MEETIKRLNLEESGEFFNFELEGCVFLAWCVEGKWKLFATDVKTRETIFDTKDGGFLLKDLENVVEKTYQTRNSNAIVVVDNRVEERKPARNGIIRPMQKGNMPNTL